MGLPITKTITLVWDGVDWRDQETGVLVEGVQRLYEHIQVQNGGVRLHGGRIIADDPAQEPHHPFDKSFHVTYEQVQKMIADALQQRAAKTHMYFEQEPEQIVTVAYHREAIGALSHEVNQLERRIMQLEKPWWRR